MTVNDSCMVVPLPLWFQDKQLQDDWAWQSGLPYTIPLNPKQILDFSYIVPAIRSTRFSSALKHCNFISKNEVRPVHSGI